MSGQITGRASLSNSTPASDYAIELNGINTTDATTRILINCGTLNATGVGYGARVLNATIDGYGVGTFITSNGNSAIGHVVNAQSNSLAIPAFAARSNGQSAGGSIGYVWMNGNTQSFFHSIMHNEELRFYNPTGTIYSIRDRLITNITFGSNYDPAFPDQPDNIVLLEGPFVAGSSDSATVSIALQRNLGLSNALYPAALVKYNPLYGNELTENSGVMEQDVIWQVSP